MAKLITEQSESNIATEEYVDEHCNGEGGGGESGGGDYTTMTNAQVDNMLKEILGEKN
jgi:hypothetical protein